MRTGERNNPRKDRTKKVAVVGAAGTVGSGLTNFFTEMGYPVKQVERQSPLTLEQAAAWADVVFIVTRPIREVAGLVNRAAAVMRRGTLLVSGSSVELPAGAETLDFQTLTVRNITFCHLHFHFRPERPLRQSLAGRQVSVCYWGDRERWSAWLEGLITGEGACLHTFNPGEHDTVTAVSQVMHMAVAAMVAQTWSELPPSAVRQGVAIGGPPCRSLTDSVLRTASGAELAAEILACHPQALPVLDKLSESLTALRHNIEARQEAAIAHTLSCPLTILSPSLSPQENKP
jgi:prephenate dehydrogenase